MLFRRHHCRACGFVICEDCIGPPRILEQFGYGKTPQKVCRECSDKAPSQVECELRLFRMADDAQQQLTYALRRKADTLTVDLTEYVTLLAEYRSYSNAVASLLAFAEAGFASAVLYTMELLMERASTTLRQLKLGSTEAAEKDVRQLYLDLNHLQRVVDRDTPTRTRILISAPPDFERVLQSLTEAYERLHSKGDATGLERALVRACLKVTKQSMESIVQHLHSLVSLLEEADRNVHVNPEVTGIAFQCLYRLSMQCLQASYQRMRRVEDNPSESVLITALVEAQDIAKTISMFQSRMRFVFPSKFVDMWEELARTAYEKRLDLAEETWSKIDQMAEEMSELLH